MKSNSTIIKETVLAMGGTLEEFLPERDCFYVNLDGKRFLLEKNIHITRDSYVSRRFTKCKDITYKLLISHGLSSPKTECFYRKKYDKQNIKKQLNNLSYPIIIKNAHGSNSLGIFPFVKDSKEAQKIIEKNLYKYQSMIAQEMVFGKEYRILVLGDKVIAVMEMILPHIIGDGVSTIKKIIEKKQKNTDRRTTFDKKFLYILKKQGVTLKTILAKKKIIFIKGNSCLAEGGETRDVTKNVHPEIIRKSILISKLVGRNLVGIDIICKDISLYPDKKHFFILEVNGDPSLDIHNSPTYGHPRNVAKKVVQFIADLSTSVSLK